MGAQFSTVNNLPLELHQYYIALDAEYLSNECLQLLDLRVGYGTTTIQVNRLVSYKLLCAIFQMYAPTVEQRALNKFNTSNLNV